MFFIMSKKDGKKITIADIYPNLSSEEQSDAEATLHRYLAVVKRIYENISEQDPKILTELRRRAKIKKRKGA